jgi:transposase
MTHSPELLACGIDPGRYAIQLALRSPSQVYCNLSLPISAKGIATFRELVPSSAEAIIEGFGTTGRLFFLELAQEGYSFFELNPRLGKHLRFLVREGRTDASDAESIAQAPFLSLRCSPLSFSEEGETLFILVRYYHRIRKDHTIHMNRLHRLLSEAYGSIYPTLRQVFHLTSQRGREFFRNYPSSNALSREGKKALVPFLSEKRMEFILSNCPIWHSTGYLRILEREIRFLLACLEEEEHHLKEILQEIKIRLQKHPEGQILLSIPGCGVVTAATLLAFIRDIHRFPTESHFAGYCGLGKVVNQSGEECWNQKRTMYHRILRGIFFQIAFASLRVSSLSRTYYQKKRREGKTHRQAILALARYYARIIYTLLSQHRLYMDEASWKKEVDSRETQKELPKKRGKLLKVHQEG